MAFTSTFDRVQIGGSETEPNSFGEAKRMIHVAVPLMDACRDEGVSRKVACRMCVGPAIYQVGPTAA